MLLFAYYLTTTEWVHCQPDMWMLLPALVALHLRRRQMGRLAEGGTPGRAVAWATLEGVCWGTACLIKPFVVVPGVLTWLTSATLLRRSGPGWTWRLAWNSAGLLAGGLLMASLWQGWLIAHGTWHDYWHNNASFRSEFYSLALPLWIRPFPLLIRGRPWGMIHLLALPVALGALARAVLTRRPLSLSGADSFSTLVPLLAAFYLGWLVQSTLIQTELDYHLAPTHLLALALVGGSLAARTRPGWRWAWVALGLFAVLYQPALAPSRLLLWGRCWRDGSSPEMRDRLALYGDDEFATHWQDLTKVERFLRDRQVRDGELLCWDGPTHPLYFQLGDNPGPHSLFPSTGLLFFPSRRDKLRAEYQAGGYRYVVTDERVCASYEARSLGKTPDPTVTDLRAISPELAHLFPYSEPVVFRAGRYLVHQVRQTDAGPP